MPYFLSGLWLVNKSLTHHKPWQASWRVKSTALLQALVLNLYKSNRIYCWDMSVRGKLWLPWKLSVQLGLDFVSLFIKYLESNILSENARTFHVARKRKVFTSISQKLHSNLAWEVNTMWPFRGSCKRARLSTRTSNTWDKVDPLCGLQNMFSSIDSHAFLFCYHSLPTFDSKAT